jgi:hypothetical protein
MTPEISLQVGPREGCVCITIVGPGTAVGAQVTLSSEQAEMTLHALGLAVAGIREAARLKAEYRAGLEERLLEQEVRLRGS